MTLAEGRPVVLWAMHTIGQLDRPREQEPEARAKQAEWGAVLMLALREWTEIEKAAKQDRE